MASPSSSQQTGPRGPQWADRVIDVLSTAVSDGVVLLGGAGEIVLLNDQAGQLFQLRPGDAEGRPFVELFSSDTLPRGGAEALWDEPVTLEAVCTRPDDTSARVGLRISPVLGPDAAPSGYVVLIEDLEAKRREEEQIRRMDRLASLGELSAGVAHEVRNPLAGIQTAAEVLIQKVGEEDSRRGFLDVILEEVRRLNRIVEDLVRFAKPGSPKLAACDLHRVIGNVLTLLSKQIEKENIRVKTRYDPGLPFVRADADQMVQVVLNVVLNSIQAMAGGGTLEISTSTGPGLGGRGDPGAGTRPSQSVRIEIADDGPGIPEDALDRVFDPFYTTKPSGTGMGLSICQRIVEAHDGMLSVRSNPDGKTRVWIDLLAEKPSPKQKEVSTPRPERSSIGSRRK